MTFPSINRKKNTFEQKLKKFHFLYLQICKSCRIIDYLDIRHNKSRENSFCDQYKWTSQNIESNMIFHHLFTSGVSHTSLSLAIYSPLRYSTHYVIEYKSQYEQKQWAPYIQTLKHTTNQPVLTNQLSFELHRRQKCFCSCSSLSSKEKKSNKNNKKLIQNQTTTKQQPPINKISE